MGKNYYCEYCDKRLKDDTNIKRKHIDGLPHQKARNEHYAHFKSAKEILKEEERKKPCAKFPNGMCQFGAMCRFSHYTPAEMAKIKEKAQLENQKQTANQEPKVYSKSMIDNFMKKQKLAKEQSEQQILREFFNYPEELVKYEGELPPSLRPIDAKTLRKDFKPNFFG